MPLKTPAGNVKVAPAPTASVGYYNYTFAIIFLLFLIFIISRGELQAWINILFSAPTPPPQVGQSPAPVVAASAAAAVNNPKVNAIPGQNAQGQPTLFPNYMGVNPPANPPPMGTTQAQNPVAAFVNKYVFGINPAK